MQNYKINLNNFYMLKYIDTQVTFAEIPDEISLCINISNCPIRCNGCHSQHLWGNIGEPLTESSLSLLIEKNTGVTCVCFMGGDMEADEVNRLAGHIRQTYPHLKIGWYSGQEWFSIFAEYKNFDYLKLGPYIKKLGGLASPKTNQRLYKVDGYILRNITSRFLKMR